MKRTLILIAAFAAVLTLSSQARAQDQAEVYAYASVSYDATCNCVIGSASFSANAEAEAYYQITNFASLEDTDGTVNWSDNPTGNVTVQADDVALGDSFQMTAQSNATLDSWYQPYTYGPPCIGGCGCDFANTGCPGCACSSLQPIELRPSVDDVSQQNASTGTCNNTDLNTIENEYTHPEMFSLPLTPIIWASYWTPVCGTFTSTDPAQLAEYGSGAFSHGDLSDWAIFQSQMSNGVNAINTTSIPSGVTGFPALPWSATSIYRTPVYSYDVQTTHPGDPHMYGLAIDFPADSSDWTAMAQWAEYTNGSNPSSMKVCIEPESDSLNSSGVVDHLHVDWRPVDSLGSEPMCYTSGNDIWQIPDPW